MRKLFTQLMMIAVRGGRDADVPNCGGRRIGRRPAPDALSQNKRLGRGVNVLGYDPSGKTARRPVSKTNTPADQAGGLQPRQDQSPSLPR